MCQPREDDYGPMILPGPWGKELQTRSVAETAEIASAAKNVERVYLCREGWLIQLPTAQPTLRLVQYDD